MAIYYSQRGPGIHLLRRQWSILERQAAHTTRLRAPGDNGWIRAILRHGQQRALVVVAFALAVGQSSPALSGECFGDIATTIEHPEIGLATKREIRENAKEYEFGDRKFFLVLQGNVNVGWIYGTQHATYPEVAYIAPPVHDALIASDVVVTETDISDSATRNHDTLRALILQTGGDLPIGDVAFNEVDVKSDRKISSILQDIHMSLKTSYETSPRSLMNRLLNYGCQAPMINIFGNGSTSDELFQSWSIALNKTTKGLETSDSAQALLLGEKYNEFVIKILPLLARRINTGPALQNFRNEAYAAGRIDYSVAADIAYLASQDERGFFYSKHLLLTKDRNKKFSEQIIEIIRAKKRPFVAIGAAHLLGQKGVLGWLKQAGYDIIPVSLSLEQQTRARLPIFNAAGN